MVRPADDRILLVGELDAALVDAGANFVAGNPDASQFIARTEKFEHREQSRGALTLSMADSQEALARYVASVLYETDSTELPRIRRPTRTTTRRIPRRGPPSAVVHLDDDRLPVRLDRGRLDDRLSSSDVSKVAGATAAGAVRAPCHDALTSTDDSAAQRSAGVPAVQRSTTAVAAAACSSAAARAAALPSGSSSRTKPTVASATAPRTAPAAAPAGSSRRAQPAFESGGSPRRCPRAAVWPDWPARMGRERGGPPRAQQPQQRLDGALWGERRVVGDFRTRPSAEAWNHPTVPKLCSTARTKFPAPWTSSQARTGPP
jgi:hypothetical protein